jgi:hypothetical protein
MITVAFVAVAVAAVVGWARKPEPGTAFNANPGYSWDQNGAVGPANAPGVVEGSQAMQAPQVESYREAVAVHPCEQPERYGYATPSYTTKYGVRTVRPRVMEEQARSSQERSPVRRGRSTGTSVAIVAGSAGVGAAIGAIAGGGKGAAIGALAGGGGGFVYDRLTHNH